ncbi:MAG: hypothetical protein AAGF26_12145 [Cyanobacteria bacterium P01_G01_bin.49]
MGYTWGFVTRETKYEALEDLLDAWSQFCRDFYFGEFKIAIDDQLYWFGNMEDASAYETSLQFSNTDTLKTNDFDGDTVVICRAGSWKVLEDQIQQQALSKGLNPQAIPGFKEELEIFCPDGSIIFGYEYDFPKYMTVQSNTAYRLQYQTAADYRYINSLTEDHREIYHQNRDIYDNCGVSEWASYMIFVSEMILIHKLLFEICYDTVSYGDPSVSPRFPWPRIKFSKDGRKL